MLANRNKARKTVEPTHCSPARFENAKRIGSCLDENDVRELAREMSITMMPDPSELLMQLHRRFGTRPGEESRWLEMNGVNIRPSVRRLLEAAFRPAKPRTWDKNPKAWLSNYDIEAVLKQYQDHLGKSRRFRFVGVFPRDFASPADGMFRASNSCVSQAMCRLSVASLRAEGISQIGIVFNLDKHNSKGSHWTAMYACIDWDARVPERFGAFYYDSIGRRPPPEMTAFAHRLRDEVADPRFVVASNGIQKQFGNTECGVFAIFFIVACLQTDMPFRAICKDLVKRDAEMHVLRSVMFRPNVL